MCKLCESKPVYEFTNKRKVCKSCFVKYFQKKFLTTIRKFEMVKRQKAKHLASLPKRGQTKGNIIGYYDGDNFRDAVLEYLLFMFGEKGTVEIVKLASPYSRPRTKDSMDYTSTTKSFAHPESALKHAKKLKVNKIAISSTIDSESNKLVHVLFKRDVKELDELNPVDKKVIKPLYLFLDEEVLLYAQIKKLKFKKAKESKDKLSKFLDNLETKHPEIKRAIVNSYLELE